LGKKQNNRKVILIKGDTLFSNSVSSSMVRSTLSLPHKVVERKSIILILDYAERLANIYI
tara:strand:+ start:192 stop:371 length:180 start_codon:yes stop_codon:yes gene_type:complete